MVIQFVGLMGSTSVLTFSIQWGKILISPPRNEQKKPRPNQKPGKKNLRQPRLHGRIDSLLKNWNATSDDRMKIVGRSPTAFIHKDGSEAERLKNMCQMDL